VEPIIAQLVSHLLCRLQRQIQKSTVDGAFQGVCIVDLTGAILLAAICVVIGFLLGALVFSLRDRSEQQEPPQEIISPESKLGLHICHSEEGGDLEIELDGLTHTHKSDLSADQVERVSQLVADLQAWLAVLSAPPSPQASPEPIEDSAEMGEEEAERTSLNPFQIFTRSWQAGEKAGSQEPRKSIVSQIDAVLQANLEGTPLEHKGIRLIEDPELGMVIEVGLDKYNDIDSITDESVRQVIHRSVAEWEGRMGD
jgi:hypothetical protein